MSGLDHFPDRTIKRAREKFTDGKRGSGDDPIATHAKVAQNVMLGHLNALLARAESGEEFAGAGIKSGPAAGLQGELDGRALIDPFISYDENVAQIKQEYGIDFKTYAEREREDMVKAADERARKHARETLRDNLEAIEAGEADELVTDIAEEYGQEFVADILGREREILEAEPAGIPEPEPEPAEPIDASPEPEPAGPPEPIAPADRPEPAAAEPASVSSPEPASPPEIEPIPSVSASIRTVFSEFAKTAKTASRLAAVAIADEAREL